MGDCINHRASGITYTCARATCDLQKSHPFTTTRGETCEPVWSTWGGYVQQKQLADRPTTKNRFYSQRRGACSTTSHFKRSMPFSLAWSPQRFSNPKVVLFRACAPRFSWFGDSLAGYAFIRPMNLQPRVRAYYLLNSSIPLHCALHSPLTLYPQSRKLKHPTADSYGTRTKKILKTQTKRCNCHFMHAFRVSTSMDVPAVFTTTLIHIRACTRNLEKNLGTNKKRRRRQASSSNRYHNSSSSPLVHPGSVLVDTGDEPNTDLSDGTPATTVPPPAPRGFFFPALMSGRW